MDGQPILWPISLPWHLSSKQVCKWRSVLATGLLQVNRWLSFDLLEHSEANASALVFAPHPDDEVLGCGGTIAIKVAAGARVKVVIMTDGRASHRGLIEADELVALRRSEAIKAAHELGLAATDYLFLDYEDHQLHHYHQAAVERVGGIIDHFEPEQIYIPHRRDSILDHIETNRIVREAASRSMKSITLLEYPVWLWNSWPWSSGAEIASRLELAKNMAAIVLGCRARVDVSMKQQQKSAALNAYASQFQRRNGIPYWPVLADVAGGEFLRCFETSFEIFRCSDSCP